MSTAYSSAKQQYIGNGVTTEWGFDFPIKKHSELKVYLKRSGLSQVLLEEGVDYSFVTENTISFPIKTGEAKLQATDVLALQRESVFESEYNFSNQQRLEPEEVMHADDNIERQIQELKRDVSQAIRIQPTSNINTDEYFIAVESIYENLDNITNVSGISAEIINCSDNISDISTVSSDIANVNAVGQSISNVNTVASNVSSVNTVAGVSTDVTAVAGISTDVSTVANNSANVTTVATNISDVNTAATNIAAIQDAPNQANSAQNSATQAAQSATSAAQSAQTAEDKADEASESARLAVSALSLQIGDIGFAPLGIDESLNLRRYLNGQVISQSQFVSFTNKVKSSIALYPNLATTEANWQAEKTNSKLGQCGKFVIDDTAGTIRLPKVININGLQDLSLLGSIKAESLPNITGSYTDKDGYSSQNIGTGAFRQINSSNTSTYVGVTQMSRTYSIMEFDASRSSSTYQDNAPVQQEAVQYPYYIQVATGVEETLPAIREYKTNVPYVLGDSKYFEASPYNASWLESNGQYNSATVYPDLWSQLQVELNSSLNVGDTIDISGKTYVKRGLPVKLSTDTYDDYDFVVNTADQTFRLPLKTKLASGSAIVGNGMALGLTNGTDNLGLFEYFGDVNIFQGRTGNYGKNVGQPNSGTTSTITNVSIGVTTDPTKSGIETSSDGLKLYYYVGDTVQDASLINAGAVLGQLSDKISRTAASDREMIVSWGMPDYTAGVSKSKDVKYTAEVSGWISLSVTNGTTNPATLTIDGVTAIYNPREGNHKNTYSPVFVGKGQKYKLTCGGTVNAFVFYPCKGVN